MADEEIVQRLDKLIAILQLAHYEDIERGRARILADELNAAILEAAAKRTPTAQVVAAARKTKGSPSPATIGRRIASLVDQGALARSGAGPSTAYEATGLV
jgi:chorismate mutase